MSQSNQNPVQKPPMQGASQAAEAPASGTATVVIACKLPHGLIMEMGKLGNPDYKSVKLNGANGARHGQHVIVTASGFGLTTVDASFWAAWSKKNARLEFMTNGSVFAQDSISNASANADANKSVKTGFEALDPYAPGNVPGAKGVEVDMGHLERGRLDRIQLAQ